MFTANKLLRPWFRLIAKQLRKPHGILATLTGRKMNASNHALYDLTLHTMNPSDNDSILEIGFGNGKFFSDLHGKAKNLQITGIDLSHEMVFQAFKNNTALFESGSMKVKVGSSENLPFEDNSFDKVFCVNVIYFWETPELHLREIYRVLKPGGKFYTGFKPAELMSQLPFTRYGFNLYSEKDWLKVLLGNKFNLVFEDKLNKKKIKPVSSKMQLDGLCITVIK